MAHRRAEIDALLTEGKELYDQRSGVVHGMRAFTARGDDVNPLPTIRFRKYGKVVGTEWPNETLFDLAERLLEVAHRVETITAAVRAEQESS